MVKGSILNDVEKKKPKKTVKRVKKKVVKKVRKTSKKSVAKKAGVRKVKKSVKKAEKRVKKSVVSKNAGKGASDIVKKSVVTRSVKKGKVVRIQTGVNKFDSLISGGFKQYSTNMIVGGSGSGKTIFATQFLMEGIKKGETCLYITFEEKKNKFYSNMAAFGWDLEKYEKQGKFIFLEYTPAKVKTMLEEGGGSIETTVLQNKVSRMVIDSITSFALLIYS